MQEGQVSCVHAAFQSLLLVAPHETLGGKHMARRQVEVIEMRQRRLEPGRAEIGPYNAPAFLDGI